jgi:RNA polymerase sigma-70 factor (ECF subfamily)
MPNEPEAHGLLALMLHCEARRAARTAREGEFVALDQHDTALWSRPMIDEAENHLRIASAFKLLGRYQLEAAIQSIHAHRAVSGVIDWQEIALLYEGLVRLAPTIGAQVGRAVALAESGDVAAGLAALDAIAANHAANYQPWWAARAHVLRRLGRAAEARAAFERAASLTDDSALRAHLLERAAR